MIYIGKTLTITEKNLWLKAEFIHHADNSELFRLCLDFDRDIQVFPTVRKIKDIDEIGMVSGIFQIGRAHV
jgi:hypothetical protein